jgi:hypothetical protein
MAEWDREKCHEAAEEGVTPRTRADAVGVSQVSSLRKTAILAAPEMPDKKARRDPCNDRSFEPWLRPTETPGVEDDRTLL